MTDYRIDESKMREPQEWPREAARAKHSSGHLVLKVIAGAVVGLVALGVVSSLHDIKRYIRMRQM